MHYRLASCETTTKKYRRIVLNVNIVWSFDITSSNSSSFHNDCSWIDDYDNSITMSVCQVCLKCVTKC